MFRNPEAAIHAYESIELTTKATCKFLDIEYDRREHFLDASTLAKLAERVSATWPDWKDRILTSIPTVVGYSEELRIITRYGIDRERTPQVSPTRLLTRDYCERIIGDARILQDLLIMIELRLRWGGTI